MTLSTHVLHEYITTTYLLNSGINVYQVVTFKKKKKGRYLNLHIYNKSSLLHYTGY